MEACMIKPEVKKKPLPPKPPPKPAERKGDLPERPARPTPLVPPRPADAELSQTQYRTKRAANTEARENATRRETKAQPSKTPLIPPRPTEEELCNTTRSSQRRRAEAEDTQTSGESAQPGVTKHSAEIKESNQSVLTGMFRRSQKEKTPSFTVEREVRRKTGSVEIESYVTEDCDKEEKTDDVPAKQAPGSKQGILKGVMKGLQLKSSPKASREPSPDPSMREGGPEKETCAEKNKQEKNAESKQDKGGLIAGIFRKAPKDKSSSSSAQTADKSDSASEDEEEAEEKSSEQLRERGGVFSGLLKKSTRTVDGAPEQENLSANSELSASNDSLSENNSNKEKGGIFGGIFKRPQKPAEAAQTDMGQQLLPDNQSGSSDNLSEGPKEKGGFFSGILRKSPKIPGEDKQSPQADQSDSNEPLSEDNAPREKGSVFSGMFRKSPRLSEAPRLEEGAESLRGELSASSDSLSENKEKGSLFGGLLRKTPKTPGEGNESTQKDLSASSDSLSESDNTKESPDDRLSGSVEALSESNTKEKGGIFSGMFKKAPKPAEAARPDEDESYASKLSTSSENLCENKQEKSGGLFSGLLKKTPKASGERTESPDGEAQKELSASNDDLSETTKEKNIFSNMFKKPQKPAEGTAAEKVLEVSREKKLSDSCENLPDATAPKEKKGGLAGIFKRSASIENLFDEEKGGLFSGLIKKTPKASGEEDKDGQKDVTASTDSLALLVPENSNMKEKSIFSGMFKKTQKPAEGATTEEESNTGEEKKLSASCENLSEGSTLKEKSGGLAGIFKKSPKPAPRVIATEDPLSHSKELFSSCDSLIEAPEDNPSELSASNENLSEAASTTKEKKGGFAGIFRRTPKTVEHQQESVDTEAPEGGGLRRRRTIKKKKRVVSFRVKTTLPRMPKPNPSSDKMPLIEESVELQDLNPAQESSVEVQPVEMAAYPAEHKPGEPEQESDELMEWWNTVKGWAEWNETSNFQEEDEEMAMEQAADRVYMAARLFVRLFNQRGASLQQRILELLALADAADQFHKKTVTAAVGGGVASVAGSVATITGLILAPFTFGASIIVTAVGISVATAGSITSATANITDTVHSNMDRKKLEKMIQDYQDEIKVIRECLEFVQAGMDTLEEWDFEKYTQSAAKKALNHNLKHVMKEGGRAGKALMINTDKLISTVQILGAAGGAAKAAQAISVTTGVMSALFLALDVFFLAKDSHELRKGAKTKFATKIRDVCKELQDGLLELNKVKTQLQKTMDGIEVEEYEEIEEVEVEVDEDFESDPKKLAELEQELDIMEEKLDKETEEKQKKMKETDKESLKDMERNEEKSKKEKEKPKDKKEGDEKEKGKKETKNGKGEKENKLESELEISDEKKEQKNEAVKAAKEEALKEKSQKGKKDKETENRFTAAKENESKREMNKEDSSPKNLTDLKEKKNSKPGKEPEEIKSRSGDSKREDSSGKTERASERSKSSREDERGMDKEKEVESGRRHSDRSDRDRPDWSERGSRHETRESDRGKAESWRRTEEDRGARDRRGETAKSREQKRDSWEARESQREGDARKEPHQTHHPASRRERPERELASTREERDSQRSHSRRGVAERDEQREGREERRGGRSFENMKRRFERAGEEVGEEEEEGERGKRKKDGESQRRDRERDRGHGHRGSRAGSSKLKEDGLYI